MRIVVDSTGIILLAKASILRSICELVGLEITKMVESEVMAGLQKGRTDALYLRELLEEGKIKRAEIDVKIAERFRKDFRLGHGEAESIALAVSCKLPLITDDNKAKKVSRVIGVEVLSSLDFPIVLYENNMITYDKAKISLEILKKDGWFGESVILEALNTLEKMRGEKK